MNPLTFKKAKEELTALRGVMLLDKLKSKHYDDDDMKIKWLKCLRCLHSWLMRMEKLPLRCPKCGSALWNKPPKK